MYPILAVIVPSKQTLAAKWLHFNLATQNLAIQKLNRTFTTLLTHKTYIRNSYQQEIDLYFDIVQYSISL